MDGTGEVSTVTPVDSRDAKSAAFVPKTIRIVLAFSLIETLKHTRKTNQKANYRAS